MSESPSVFCSNGQGERRLAPEWVSQAGVLMAWPHAGSDWMDSLPAAQQTVTAIVNAIAKRQTVGLIAADARIAQRLRSRRQHQRLHQNVRILTAPYNDTWLRDSGPLAVADHSGWRLLDFRFNGWGGKYSAERDDRLPATLFHSGQLRASACQRIDIEMEGGAIDYDGDGHLLTTQEWLDARGHEPAEFAQWCGHWFGVRKLSVLPLAPLAGDDTDGHVDMLARFLPMRNVVYQSCDDSKDIHFNNLKRISRVVNALRDCQHRSYQVFKLPWPQARYSGDDRLPLSYANFLFINGAVLMPTYGVPQDSKALAVLRAALPDYEVIGIHCRTLVEQHGSLHCMTMQLPAGVDMIEQPAR